LQNEHNKALDKLSKEMALKEQKVSKMVFDQMTEKTRKMADSFEKDMAILQQDLSQSRKQGANDKAQLNIVTA
jgi:hypothetical protein